MPKPNTPTTAMRRWRGPELDVAMAADWCCNNCFKPLRPSAVRRGLDGAIVVICENCHAGLLTIEPLPAGLSMIDRLEGRP